MKRTLLLVMLAAPLAASAGLPDFRVGEILILQDNFIALKIENASPHDWAPDAADREQVFLRLFINGVNRAEYLVKSVEPTLFLRRSMIVFKTNFRVIAPLRIRVELNGEKAVPESDYRNNLLEASLQPAP